MRRRASLLPVILAGGEGKRLAPIAGPGRPKPFIPLPGGKSLLALTCERIKDAACFAPPILVGQDAHRFSLLNHARDAEVAPAAILLEPEPQNTAMAVAVAVAHVLAKNGQAVLAVLPADHVIGPVEAWQETLLQAAEATLAAQAICLLAVAPATASSHYGYMALAPKEGWFAVERFIEKPTRPQDMLKENQDTLRWAWNTGQFIAPASLFAQLLELHAPDIWAAANHAVSSALQTWEFTVLGPSAYHGLAAVPFDRAVVEKAPTIALTLTASWRDLGQRSDWESFTGMAASLYAARPPRTDRPWGYFEVLSTGAGRLEKKLTLYPGCRISRQRHQLRSEIWEVLEGAAHVELSRRQFILQKGDSVTVPPACWHRLSNNNNNLLIIKEIQSGMPDENDIERSDDDYGRV